MQKVLATIRRIRFTQSTLRQASFRENKGPSLGKIEVKIPHHRSPYAVKFEDRSHEETERQQQCAARHGILPEIFTSSKKRTKLHSTGLPMSEWIMPAASTMKPEERDFVVDSGASMHMVSKKDLNSAEP